jgi:hypothetical protein
LRKITAGPFISFDSVVENLQNWNFRHYADYADYAAETAATGVWTPMDQPSPRSPR